MRIDLKKYALWNTCVQNKLRDVQIRIIFTMSTDHSTGIKIKRMNKYYK